MAESVGVELGIAPLFDIALPFGFAPFIGFDFFMFFCMVPWCIGMLEFDIEPELIEFDIALEPIEPLAWAMTPVASASDIAHASVVLIMRSSPRIELRIAARTP